MTNVKQVGGSKVGSFEATESREKSTDVGEEVVLIEVHKRKRSNEDSNERGLDELEMGNKITDDRLI